MEKKELFAVFVLSVSLFVIFLSAANFAVAVPSFSAIPYRDLTVSSIEITDRFCTNQTNSSCNVYLRANISNLGNTASGSSTTNVRIAGGFQYVIRETRIPTGPIQPGETTYI